MGNRLSAIAPCTGDGATTGLGDGIRVSKAGPRGRRGRWTDLRDSPPEDAIAIRQKHSAGRIAAPTLGLC